MALDASRISIFLIFLMHCPHIVSKRRAFLIIWMNHLEAKQRLPPTNSISEVANH